VLGWRCQRDELHRTHQRLRNAHQRLRTGCASAMNMAHMLRRGSGGATVSQPVL
jgi:hypothetical protein